MERLRDMSDADPQLGRAQQLLAQVAPLSRSSSDVRRLRQQLAARATRPRQRRGLLLLTAMIVFAGSALAAAQSLGVLQRLAMTQSPAPKADAKAQRSARQQPAVRSTPPKAAFETGLAPTTASQPLPAAVPQPVVRRRQEPDPTSEAELVRRALKALRRDGEPARAAQLLEQAHTRNPDGALAEEIMSLRVEVALARNDRRAAALARQYLARYPEGRYQAVALRALTSER